jgi:hypothetical protein
MRRWACLFSPAVGRSESPFHALHLLTEVNGTDALESLLPRFLSLHPGGMAFRFSSVSH